MTIENASLVKRRLITCGFVPLVVAFGLGCKVYRGPGSDWVNNWGPASVAYEWLFMLLVFVVIPRRGVIIRIAVAVFVGTCLIEFLQLWKPVFLQAIRATLPGRLVLGSTYSWWDFPGYLVGCVTGVFLLRGVCHVTSGARGNRL